jgi:hypothetical protein
MIRPGQTSITVEIGATDEGGIPLTGKVAADFPTLYAAVGNRAQSIALTKSDLALITTAWTEGGIKQKSGAGVYRYDLPDAVADILLGEHIITIYGYASGFVVWEQFEVAFADSVMHAGVARAGSSSTIQLATTASPAGDAYVSKLIKLVGGTGSPDAQVVSGYNASTRTVTVGQSWIIDTPDASTVYEVVNTSMPVIGQVGRAWADIRAVNDDIDSATRLVDVLYGNQTVEVGNVTVGGYAVNKDPGFYVLRTPANKLLTDVDGNVTGVSGTLGNLTITPLLAAVSNPRYSSRNLATIAAGTAPTDILTVTDGTGAAIDLSGRDLRLVAYLRAGEEDGYDPENDADSWDAALTPAFKYETGSSGNLSVGGADSNQVTIAHDAQDTGRYRYWLLDVTDESAPLALVKGRLPIEPSVLDV